MTEAERFIITLASGIELFRTRPEAVAEKRAALKSLTDLSSRDMFKFNTAGKQLRIQGKLVDADLPGAQVLVQQCREHRIAEVRVAQRADEADLLLLLQALAAEPDDSVPLPDGGTVSVVDQGSVMAPVELDDQPLGMAAARSVSDIAQSAEETLQELEQNPASRDVVRSLDRVVAGVEYAFAHHQAHDAVQLIRRLMPLEAQATEVGPRRAYAVAFRQLFTRINLEMIAEAVDDARCTVAAGEVLVRSGLAGAEALIRRLRQSRDVDHCTRYVQVLSEMPECASYLLPLVDEEQWTSACGAVELLGEFGYTRGVEALARALNHPDKRVCRTAAAALTRIGTREAVAHVQKALLSEDEGMRTAVAMNVEGRKSGALAMPLLRVAEDERDRPEVVRDCYVALGRIGTPVAVQALVEASRPGGRMFGKKPLEDRLAAVEGLGYAESAVATQRLLELAEDRDPAIRAAASDALDLGRDPGTAVS